MKMQKTAEPECSVTNVIAANVMFAFCLVSCCLTQDSLCKQNMVVSLHFPRCLLQPG